MKSFFQEATYAPPLLFLFSGADNLCSALVRLQEQRPISLKVMSTLQFYKCKKKKFFLNHIVASR